MLGDFASAQAVFFFRQHNDAAAFGRFIGKARKLRGIGQFGFVNAVGRDEFDRLAIAERDGAGLVEQQRVDIARRFDGLAAHGEHVVLHDAVHAGDADGGEQAADGGRDQADEQRDQHDDGGDRARFRLIDAVLREGRERDDRQQEDQRKPGDHDVQRDFIGRFLPLRAFDESDHAVEERFAGVRSDLNLDVIREHFGAAGDRTAIAAGFANDRRAFARDDRFIDAGDAFDDIAIAGNHVVRFAEADIAFAQQRRGNDFNFAVAAQASSPRRRFSFYAGCRPGLCRGPRPWLPRSSRTAR